MERPSILQSCYVARSLVGEQFIPEHAFCYQISGLLTLNDGKKEYVARGGQYRFIRRNRLAKYVKEPPVNGEYRSVSVSFSQEFLQNLSREYGYKADGNLTSGAVIELQPNSLFDNYMHSLHPYFNITGTQDTKLLELKTKEAALILLQTNPELKNVLFDFSEPGKIDLEAFMNRNFKFNVSMQRFAYLTGRSMTTFKRDFEKIYQTSPGRWLVQRRLQEAHYLIEKKRQKPSDVYLEVGFEDLSHFSFAFKKTYGVSPSHVTENRVVA